MAQVVTFDPVNLRIIETANGADNTITWVEIHSEWKTWLLADPSRLAYPPAFRGLNLVEDAGEIGGNPTPEGALGITFFMNTAAGWRFRPAELNHRVTVLGNVYGNDGQPIDTFTLGSYQVIIKLLTSLQVQQVAVLELGQVRDIVQQVVIAIESAEID